MRRHQNDMLLAVLRKRDIALELLDAAGWPDGKDIHRRNYSSLLAILLGVKPVTAINIGVVATDGETGDPLHGWLAKDGKIYVHGTWGKYCRRRLDREPQWFAEAVSNNLTNVIYHIMPSLRTRQ